MSQHTIKIGVIGAGRIGQVHTATITTRILDAEVTTIADIDIGAAEATAQRFRIPQVTNNYLDVLNDAAIDAVAICSSTDTHAQMVQDAAIAGKHIFCEKPIDHSLEKIDAVLSIVQKAGIKFQVGFNRRFDANFSKVREAVAAGEIGKPHLLHIISRDPSPPPLSYIKVSGGIFLDMTIHDFDMARFLMDSEVEELYTAAGVLVDPEIGAAGDLDTAVITLKFENGAIGTIENSRQAVYGYDQRVEVFGSAGKLQVFNNRPNTHMLSNANGAHLEKPYYFFLDRYMDSYEVEMKAFVKAVIDDVEPPVVGIDGRNPVVMALAARRSWEQNRPVKLREIDS
jgi:myo-inositol 2-dehydrogenase/D-chiro-inositol 1-dehydrogenase